MIQSIESFFKLSAEQWARAVDRHAILEKIPESSLCQTDGALPETRLHQRLYPLVRSMVGCVRLSSAGREILLPLSGPRQRFQVPRRLYRVERAVSRHRLLVCHIRSLPLLLCLLRLCQKRLHLRM